MKFVSNRGLAARPGVKRRVAGRPSMRVPGGGGATSQPGLSSARSAVVHAEDFPIPCPAPSRPGGGMRISPASRPKGVW